MSLTYPPKLYRTRGPHRGIRPGDRVRDEVLRTFHLADVAENGPNGADLVPLTPDRNYPGATYFGTVEAIEDVDTLSPPTLRVRWDDGLTTRVAADETITLL